MFYILILFLVIGTLVAYKLQKASQEKQAWKEEEKEKQIQTDKGETQQGEYQERLRTPRDLAPEDTSIRESQEEPSVSHVRDAGEIPIEQEKKVGARTKFIAWLSLILLLPFCIIVGGLLYTGGYRGVVSVLLCMGPFVYICLRCFITDKREFLGLITSTEIRLIYLVCFILAFFLGNVWEWRYSAGPFIAGIVFLGFEPVLQYLMFKIFY